MFKPYDKAIQLRRPHWHLIQFPASADRHSLVVMEQNMLWLQAARRALTQSRKFFWLKTHQFHGKFSRAMFPSEALNMKLESTGASAQAHLPDKSVLFQHAPVLSAIEKSHYSVSLGEQLTMGGLPNWCRRMQAISNESLPPKFHVPPRGSDGLTHLHFLRKGI